MSTGGTSLKVPAGPPMGGFLHPHQWCESPLLSPEVSEHPHLHPSTPSPPKPWASSQLPQHPITNFCVETEKKTREEETR